MTGQTLNQYEIAEKLGEGGMGVVYKAWDSRLRRHVALKFLRPDAMGSGEARARFLREAQAAASLDHPNICHVHDIEEADGQTFMVMAYCEGTPLSRLIAGGAVRSSEAIDVAIKAGEALRAAHIKGIVHRDVKSANILVSPAGEVKLTDFGLALLSDRSRITRTGTLMGTLSYMAPEQALGKKVDRRADIWSLGIVLYEMLCGCRPFDRTPSHRSIAAIVKEEMPPLKTQPPVPEELARIVHKALTKNIDERYQYMDDFVVDLKALLRQMPGPNWVAAPGSLRALEELANAPTVTLRPDAPVAELVPIAPPKKRNWLWIAGGAALAGLCAGAWLILR